MGRRRRDLGVGVGGVEGQRRVVGIVERVDDEVRGAGVIRVLGEDPFGNRRGQRLAAEAGVARAHRAEQRQRVPGRHLVVVRPLLVHPRQGRRIRDVAGQLVAGAVVERLHRLEERLLLGQLRLGQPGLVRRGQLLERLLGLVEILLRPERMVVAHRLAPVGEREVRVGLLRLLEGDGGLVELEAVQRLDAGEERLLGASGSRRGEGDRAELLSGDVRRQRQGRHCREPRCRHRTQTHHGMTSRVAPPAAPAHAWNELAYPGWARRGWIRPLHAGRAVERGADWTDTVRDGGCTLANSGGSVDAAAHSSSGLGDRAGDRRHLRHRAAAGRGSAGGAAPGPDPPGRRRPQRAS